MKKFIKIINTVCTMLIAASCCTAFGMNVALPTFADARTDTGFKALMNDLKTAENIINAVVPDFAANPIILDKTDSVYIPPLKTAENQKQVSMDYHAICANGEHVVVEMQVERHVMFDERALFYACDTYTRQLQNNILAQPHWYENLKKVYAIQFLDYNTNVAFSTKRKDDPLIMRKEGHPMEKGQYIKHFVFTDKTSGQTIDYLQMIQIELPRAEDILHLEPTQENITANIGNKIWLWLSIIKNAISYNDNLYIQIPDDVKNGLNRLRIAEWNLEDTEKYKEDKKRVNQFETSILDAKNEESKKRKKKDIVENFYKCKKICDDIQNADMNIVFLPNAADESDNDIVFTAQEALVNEASNEKAPYIDFITAHKKLPDLVEYFKNKGKAEGLAEGEAKKARETAMKLLSRNMDIKDISDITGLPAEEIARLNRP